MAALKHERVCRERLTTERAPAMLSRQTEDVKQQANLRSIRAYLRCIAPHGFLGCFFYTIMSIYGSAGIRNKSRYKNNCVRQCFDKCHCRKADTRIQVGDYFLSNLGLYSSLLASTAAILQSVVFLSALLRRLNLLPVFPENENG